MFTNQKNSLIVRAMYGHLKSASFNNPNEMSKILTSFGLHTPKWKKKTLPKFYSKFSRVTKNIQKIIVNNLTNLVEKNVLYLWLSWSTYNALWLWGSEEGGLLFLRGVIGHWWGEGSASAREPIPWKVAGNRSHRVDGRRAISRVTSCAPSCSHTHMHRNDRRNLWMLIYQATPATAARTFRTNAHFRRQVTHRNHTTDQIYLLIRRNLGLHFGVDATVRKCTTKKQV